MGNPQPLVKSCTVALLSSSCIKPVIFPEILPVEEGWRGEGREKKEMRCQFSQSVANGKLQRVHVSTEYALRSILLIQTEGCRGFSSLLWASFRLSHVSSSVCVKSSGQCSADKKRAPQGLPLVHSLLCCS